MSSQRNTAVAVALAVACASAVALLWIASAGGQSSIRLTPSSSPPGGNVAVAGTVPLDGTGCPSGDPAQLTSTAALFPPDGFGPEAARSPNGAFQTTFAVPADTPAGTYKIVIRCGGGNTGIAADLRVVTATASTTSAPTTASPTTAKSPTTTTAKSPTSTVVPGTTTTVPATATTKKSNTVRWIVLAVAALVILLAAAALVVRRRRVR